MRMGSFIGENYRVIAVVEPPKFDSSKEEMAYCHVNCVLAMRVWSPTILEILNHLTLQQRKSRRLVHLPPPESEGPLA